jgi:hypothetical protein
MSVDLLVKIYKAAATNKTIDLGDIGIINNIEKILRSKAKGPRLKKGTKVVVLAPCLTAGRKTGRRSTVR